MMKKVQELLGVIFCVVGMELKRTFRYSFGVLSDIIIYGALLVFFLASDTGKSFGERYAYTDYKVLFLIGYCGWLYAVSAVSGLSQEITGEMKQGTFYRLCNSRFTLLVLLSGKMLAQFILQCGIILVFVIGAMLLGKVKFMFSWQMLMCVVISSLGMYGMGMLLAGLTIYYKKTNSIIYIVQLGLLFVTDTLPTSSDIMGITAIIPLTAGNTLMRKLIVGQGYAENYIWLVVISGVWLLVGVVVLKKFCNLARKKGNMLFY